MDIGRIVTGALPHTPIGVAVDAQRKRSYRMIGYRGIAATYALDKADLAALRTANSVVFRFNGESARIEAIRDADDRNPWSQCRIIGAGLQLTCYQEDSYIRSAFASVGMSKYSTDPCETIIGLLKVGDRISLRFMAGNDNDYNRSAGLHHDVLYLLIHRGTEEKTATQTFMVRSDVCPANTARMCQTSLRAYANAS